MGSLRAWGGSLCCAVPHLPQGLGFPAVPLLIQCPARLLASCLLLEGSADTSCSQLLSLGPPDSAEPRLSSTKIALSRPPPPAPRPPPLHWRAFPPSRGEIKEIGKQGGGVRKGPGDDGASETRDPSKSRTWSVSGPSLGEARGHDPVWWVYVCVPVWYVFFICYLCGMCSYMLSVWLRCVFVFFWGV